MRCGLEGVVSRLGLLRPFDVQVYKPFDRERSTSGHLRRQVASGLNGLIAQHDISVAELAG